MEQFPSLHHVAVSAQPTAELEEALARGLPASRWEAIRRQRQPNDRLARLLGSALLAAAAAAQGRRFDPKTVHYPPDGPPEWLDGPVCSLSHCAGHVVLLLGGPASVGVDVEMPGAATADDLRLVLPPGLKGLVESGSLDPTDAWMRVEAALKAFGVGLRGLQALVFDDGTHARWQQQSVYLQSVSLTEQQMCWCAQAAPWAEVPIRIVHHRVEDLVELLAASQPSRIPAPRGIP